MGWSTETSTKKLRKPTDFQKVHRLPAKKVPSQTPVDPPPCCQNRHLSISSLLSGAGVMSMCWRTVFEVKVGTMSSLA